jgi:hypothetical protein
LFLTLFHVNLFSFVWYIHIVPNKWQLSFPLNSESILCSIESSYPMYSLKCWVKLLSG